MLKAWSKIGEEKKLASAYGKVFYMQEFRNPTDDNSMDFALFSFRNWSMVMAVTIDGKVVVEHQYRQGCNKVICSLPAGTADKDNEMPEALVARELEEETGYIAGSLIPLGIGYAHASGSPTVGYHYLALDCTPTGIKNNDVNEEMEIELVPVKEWFIRVLAGEIDEPHSCFTTIRAMKHLNITLDFSSINF